MPVVSMLLVVWGCGPVGPEHERPGMALPAEFSQGGVKWKRHTSGGEPAGGWWRVYGDGELTALVERSLAGNQDLMAAAARVRQARELSRAARSLYFPEVNLGAGASRSKMQQGPVVMLESRFEVPVDLQYEVDLWGKVRRQVESTAATAAATGETLQAMRLSVAGEVVQTYWALRAVDANREVLALTLQMRRRAFELLEKRRAAGSLSALDLARAETEVASAESERIQLDRERVALVNALAVLTGRAATGFVVAERNDLPKPPSVPVSVPSELLRRRPDIRAAERRVAAANADIGVATAAFYPALSIRASAGPSAGSWADLWQASSLVWSLGANAVTPVTRRDSLKARQQAAVAAHQAASAEYRQIVLEAIREVETALQGATILERRQVAQDQALAAARKAFELSTNRYKAGLLSFLDVIDAERTRLDAERRSTAVRAERLAVSVALIKSLGGRWD